MIRSPKKYFFAASVFWLMLPIMLRAQSLPVNPGAIGSGTNLSSVVYFDPPNEQVMKVRLSGAEMTTLPGTLYDVKKLKIERFGLDGRLEAVAQAPQCIYAPLDGTANSAGHLDLIVGGGKMHVQGEGFLWQQEQSTLILSNQVRTVIDVGNWKMTTP